MATVQKPCDCNSPSIHGIDKQAQLTVISLAPTDLPPQITRYGCGSVSQGSGLRVDFSRGWKESSRQCPAIRTESCSSRRQGLFGGRKRRTIGADLVATVALCPIEGRICQFHQLNRIARVVRKRSYTNAKQDLLEASLRHLQDAAAMYDQLAHSAPWITIKCFNATSGTMRSVQEIAREVLAAVEPLLRATMAADSERSG